VGDISAVGRAGGRDLSSANHYVDVADLRTLRAKTFPAGTVVFAKIGEAIRQNFRAVVTRPLLLDNNAMGATPGPGIDSTYLFHFLSSIDLYPLAQSTTVPSLRKSDLARIPIPLPPIEEQRRIAAVLDAADALRAKRRQALAKLDTLTQAIFIDMFGDPLAEDPGRELGELVRFVGGGTPSKAVPEYFEGDICWATSKDMRGRFLDNTIDHITSEAVASSATKLVPPGTVLVVVKSKVLAHRLPVTISRVPTCFGQDLKGLLPHDGVTSEFVANCLRASASWLLRQARGVNTEGLTLEQLRRTPVPRATRTEIGHFTVTIKAVEVRRNDVAESLEQLNTLFASLQQRAFRGEL